MSIFHSVCTDQRSVDNLLALPTKGQMLSPTSANSYTNLIYIHITLKCTSSSHVTEGVSKPTYAFAMQRLCYPAVKHWSFYWVMVIEMTYSWQWTLIDRIDLWVTLNIEHMNNINDIKYGVKWPNHLLWWLLIRQFSNYRWTDQWQTYNESSINAVN